MTDNADVTVEQLREKLAVLQQIQALQVQIGLAPQTAVATTEPTTTTPATQPHVKNVKVPEGRYNMSQSEFRTYATDCRSYFQLTGLTDAQVVLQLRLNMDSDLKRAIDTNYPEWNTQTVEEAINTVKEIVKQTSNPAVYIKEFDNIVEGENESIREFITRLRSCAIDCSFTCPYEPSHDLTDYMIINRIRSGVFDKTLQQELLQKQESLNTLPLIVKYCEEFESAKLDQQKLSEPEPVHGRSTIATVQKLIEEEEVSGSEIVAAISMYRQKKNGKRWHKNKKGASNIGHNDSKNSCGFCGGQQHQKRKDCPASGVKCLYCGYEGHFQQVCKKRLSDEAESTTNGDGSKQASNIAVAKIINAVQRVATSQVSDSLPRIGVHIGDGFSKSPQNIDSVPDTGAEVSVCGTHYLDILGIKRKHLSAPPHKLKHVGGGNINIVGSCKMSFKLMGIEHIEDVYFIEGVGNMFMSLTACKKLRIVPETFPSPIPSPTCSTTETCCEAPPASSSVKLPLRPDKIPLEPVEENIPGLKQWLVDAFSSVFLPPDGMLPKMNCKEHHIYLKEGAVPYAVHSPIPSPHHWREGVDNLLDQWVRKGLLAKVGVGEPVDWCTRLVPVTKKDGTPRIAADFQELNKHIKRETHHTPYPFNSVNRIPNYSHKT